VITFYSRFEKALRKSVTGEAAGRLQGSTGVVIVDVDNAAITKTAQAKYELFGPGDVQRLATGAITRRFPAPNASDAEATKVALVEFAAHDLPWRYTPRLSGAALRPWVVLVVGRRAADDVVLRRDGRVTLGVTAQKNHVLAQSAQWAHVQEVDGHSIGRVIAPPRLGPGGAEADYLADTEYVACLVPAFTADGGDAWNGTAAVTCDLYDWWTFRTGPEGDFRELAKKLHKADLVALEQRAGKPFGRAEVNYTRRTTPVTTTPLGTAGALMLPPTAANPGPAGAVPAAIAQEVRALSQRIVTPDGRGVVSAPRYDAPFADANNAAAVPPAGGWIDELRSDPRLRGAAGLGAWNGIAWQDRIADAAAAKAGDLAIARDRIGHVAFGVELSRSLWRRRLPADPVNRLAVLAPALARLVTTTNTSVLDAIAGRTPDLTRALFSSAARRALRPGPARTALTADGSAPFGAVLKEANQCRERPDPAQIRRTGDDPLPQIRKALTDAAGGDAKLADFVLNLLGPNPSPGAVAAALRALAPDERGERNRDLIARTLSRRDFAEPDRTILEWSAWMNAHGRRPPCRPVLLEPLSKAVADAIDPTVPRPPVVERVLSTLPGIKHIGPVEIEPELDLPLWSFVSEKAPDWMLPGAGDLLDGDVVALSTNPTFVEALLVGANHQTTAELRWRNLPLVTRWSPLRKFWQRKANDVDIVPIKSWPATAAFGTAALVPPLRTAEAVVVFRTPLFRRYPATVVYLYPATLDWNVPSDTDDLTSQRVLPTFTGNIGKDVTFFGFPVKPDALASHWVVLEEPPSGYSFRHKPEQPPEPMPPGSTAAAGSSSNFAFQRFAVPVRVLIGELMSNTP
jgi:hypothetical protein